MYSFIDFFDWSDLGDVWFFQFNFADIDNFQWTIFRFVLCLILCITLAIFIAWNLYGANIAERFMKPVSSKILEELKSGVTDLKLPAEHSPRL